MTDPKRRWLRFSLRTLFVVVMVFACWLGYELNWLHRRQHLLANGWCGSVGNQPPGMLWLFTNDGYYEIWKRGGLSQADSKEIGNVEALFPESVVKR
jgi:hypothetical protein